MHPIGCWKAHVFATAAKEMSLDAQINNFATTKLTEKQGEFLCKSLFQKLGPDPGSTRALGAPILGHFVAFPRGLKCVAPFSSLCARICGAEDSRCTLTPSGTAVSQGANPSPSGAPRQGRASTRQRVGAELTPWPADPGGPAINLANMRSLGACARFSLLATAVGITVDVALALGLCEFFRREPLLYFSQGWPMAGSKPGERRGGRKAGTKNKATLARQQAQAEASAQIAQALGPEAFDGDAHALLVMLYKDASQPISVRIDAAKAALPYEKPRLASVSVALDDRQQLYAAIKQIAEEAHRQRLAERGGPKD